MFERILALFLLIIGGAITLYVLFKAALSALEPLAQKKLEQKIQRDKFSQLQNNLQVGRQLDQQIEQENSRKTKK